jgi:hypothetical protein
MIGTALHRRDHYRRLKDTNGPTVTTKYVRTVNGVPESAVVLSEADLTLGSWPDGEYTLTANATDECGNVSNSIVKTVNIDTIKPEIRFSYIDGGEALSEASYYKSLTRVRH